MWGSSKTKSAKAIRSLLYPLAFVSIVAVGILAFSTKTDDFLRDMLVKHSDFIDPSSALFRNVTYSSSIGLIPAGHTWCGEVNAKNRMGGYVGWSPFKIWVYEGDVFVTVRKPEDMPFRLSTDLLDSSCRNAEPAPLWAPLW